MRPPSGRGSVWAVCLLVAALAAWPVTSAQEIQEDYRFRPDHERELYVMADSPYGAWLKKEAIPVYTGASIPNLYELALKPWKRLGTGILGAYIYLDGTGGLVDSFCVEIPPERQTKPEKHIFEEQILVLSGQGVTHIWQNDKEKVRVPWRKGTVFSPPLNTWHEHVNTGREPARFVAISDLPLKLDIFRSESFIFENNHLFLDRYAGQADYFDPEKSLDFGPVQGRHSVSIVNLVRNAWSWRLFHAGQGVGDVDRHLILSHNTMGAHVEQFPVGTYERAHRHGPGASIVLLSGEGHTLEWPSSFGSTPWKDGHGDKVVRIDWKAGTMVVPPNQWYHQHFNTGKEPARFIRLGSTPGNDIYRMSTKHLAGGENHMILFRDEDPYVRETFEKELARHGAKIRMPPMEQLIELERDGGEETLRRVPSPNAPARNR